MRRFIPRFLLSWYHLGLTFAAALWYGFPSRKLLVIGVTGTNGKTTTVDLLHNIFSEAGHRVASASSIRFIVGPDERRNESKMTMPGRFFIQQFLAEAVSKGCDVAILEVTSEGIRQHRHRFVDFNVAAMTNVTPEHIESHGSFEKYLKSKLKLFRATARSPKSHKAIVVNGDDPHAGDFMRHASKETLWVYGIRFPSATFFHEVKPSSYTTVPQDGVRLVLKNLDFHIKLKGEFNVYNALCAITIALSQNVSIHAIRQALESSGGIPGRLEYIQKEPFGVVVDYAHTPDALEKVYTTLKAEGRKLICVLGSTGGGRDSWKRPEMGKIADSMCDTIILTNEDPYDERPEKIIDDVRAGIVLKKVQVVFDRKDAVWEGVKAAFPGDTVVITGKGCEPWMVIEGGKKVPWDDRAVAREALERIRV